MQIVNHSTWFYRLLEYLLFLSQSSDEMHFSFKNDIDKYCGNWVRI